MTTCKSCRKEIDPQAKKCPHCQSFQVWYLNPQIISFIFIPFIFLPVFLTSFAFRSKPFSEYQNSFKTEFVNKVTGSSRLTYTYKISNSTKLKWGSISYAMIGTDSNGNVLISKSGSEFSWLIQPNSTAFLSVDVEDNQSVSKWELNIVDMRTDRF